MWRFKLCDEIRQTHHDALGLLVSRLLHKAGQLTEVPLVLLQEAWRSIAGGAQQDHKVTWHLQHVQFVIEGLCMCVEMGEVGLGTSPVVWSGQGCKGVWGADWLR